MCNVWHVMHGMACVPLVSLFQSAAACVPPLIIVAMHDAVVRCADMFLHADDPSRCSATRTKVNTEAKVAFLGPYAAAGPNPSLMCVDEY